jgi:hypothetical protein
VGCEGAIIHRDLENREGRTPKTLRFFAIFRFSQTSRQLRRGEGAGGGKSGWIRGRCREEVYSSPTNR